jgi:hypothetical protein
LQNPKKARTAQMEKWSDNCEGGQVVRIVLCSAFPAPKSLPCQVEESAELTARSESQRTQLNIVIFNNEINRYGIRLLDSHMLLEFSCDQDVLVGSDRGMEAIANPSQ